MDNMRHPNLQGQKGAIQVSFFDIGRRILCKVDTHPFRRLRSAIPEFLYLVHSKGRFLTFDQLVF